MKVPGIEFVQTCVARSLISQDNTINQSGSFKKIVLYECYSNIGSLWKSDVCILSSLFQTYACQVIIIVILTQFDAYLHTASWMVYSVLVRLRLPMNTRVRNISQNQNTTKFNYNKNLIKITHHNFQRAGYR